MDEPRTGDPSRAVKVPRVHKAYEYVTDQLRESILSGAIPPGEKLPNEATLSSQFGVSRATVREALRALAAQSLIRTSAGATGGSFVTVPDAGNISDSLSSDLSLLSQTESFSVEEFLELREFLEVPAARLAARRHTPEGLERLAAAIPDESAELTRHEKFISNMDFHSQVVLASGNTLLNIAAQPVFFVLRTHLRGAHLGRLSSQVHTDHEAIAQAIAAGDEDLAAEHMQKHLEDLRPAFERAWQQRNDS